MDEDRPALTRADFLSEEDWLRYRHEGGFPPWDEDAEEARCIPPVGSGQWAALTRAINGPDEEAYRRTWEGYGVSGHLSVDDFVRGYQAVALANCRERVMDIHLTVTWSTMGITTDLEVQRHHRLLLAKVHRWYAAHHCWPSLLWVLERGKRHGLHSHLLVGAPPELRAELCAFLYQAADEAVAPNKPLETPGLHTTFVGCERQDVEVQWRRLRYFYKEADPAAGWTAHRTGAWCSLPKVAVLDLKDEGEVWVDRMGVSRGLDSEAFAVWAARVALPPIKPLEAEVPHDLFGFDFVSWSSGHHLALEVIENELASQFAEEAFEGLSVRSEP